MVELLLHAGGDALASDLIWRELRVLAEKKPVIASMGDVAASGMTPAIV
jgi:protease-4